MDNNLEEKINLLKNINTDDSRFIMNVYDAYHKLQKNLENVKTVKRWESMSCLQKEYLDLFFKSKGFQSFSLIQALCKHSKNVHFCSLPGQTRASIAKRYLSHTCRVSPNPYAASGCCLSKVIAIAMVFGYCVALKRRYS